MTDKNSLIFSEAGPLNPLTDDIDDSTEALLDTTSEMHRFIHT